VTSSILRRTSIGASPPYWPLAALAARSKIPAALRQHGCDAVTRRGARLAGSTLHPCTARASVPSRSGRAGGRAQRARASSASRRLWRPRTSTSSPAPRASPPRAPSRRLLLQPPRPQQPRVTACPAPQTYRLGELDEADVRAALAGAWSEPQQRAALAAAGGHGGSLEAIFYQWRVRGGVRGSDTALLEEAVAAVRESAFSQARAAPSGRGARGAGRGAERARARQVAAAVSEPTSREVRLGGEAGSAEQDAARDRRSAAAVERLCKPRGPGRACFRGRVRPHPPGRRRIADRTRLDRGRLPCAAASRRLRAAGVLAGRRRHPAQPREHCLPARARRARRAKPHVARRYRRVCDAQSGRGEAQVSAVSAHAGCTDCCVCSASAYMLVPHCFSCGRAREPLTLCAISKPFNS
jgi:hypothetical protein